MDKQNIATKVAPEDLANFVWQKITAEANMCVYKHANMRQLIQNKILTHNSMAQAIAYILCSNLCDRDLPDSVLRPVAIEALQYYAYETARDVIGNYQGDPACLDFIEPVIYFKGFRALQTWRIANWCYNNGQKILSLVLQSRCSMLYQVDIHPNSKIGCGIMFDHATGIVVGETATIGDDCYIFQGVTLGGTGYSTEKRHPQLGNHVIIGASAVLLGHIRIGDRAKIGANSVVLKDIPADATAVGNPAKVISPS